MVKNSSDIEYRLVVAAFVTEEHPQQRGAARHHGEIARARQAGQADRSATMMPTAQQRADDIEVAALLGPPRSACARDTR
ncbi:MAG: hypothetical protein IPM80_00020 [Proteobacteria bacterium]|nr:hypothetical protein [Pseudomonadota bacterium]